MAFPTMGAPTTGYSYAVTNHPIPMPATVDVGRLLVVVIGASDTISTPSGWNLGRFTSASATVNLYAFWKITDGTEDGTTVTFVSATTAYLGYHVYYASDAGYNSGCIAFSTGTTGTSTTPDPDSLTSGFGAVDTTWIACMAAATNDVTGFPASYGNTAEQYFIYGVSGVADRDVNGSSQNPGSFTIGSAAWAAFTIGIKPTTGVIPTLTSVSPDQAYAAATGVVVTGTNFKASQGTGQVYLADGSNYITASKVAQTITSWADTSITFTVTQGSLAVGSVYLFVLNDDTNYTVTALSFEILDAPIALSAIAGDGARAMGLEVYAAGGSASMGFIRNIISADTDEAITEGGIFRVSVPASTANRALLTVGREIAIHRESEGAIFWGIIERIETSIVDDERILTISGPDLQAELGYLNTYQGLIASARSVSNVLNDLATAASWTRLLTGASYPTITKRWDQMSLQSAIYDLATISDAYTRLTSTKRQIEMKNSSTRTGIRLTNAEVSGSALRSNAGLGLINSLQLKQEGDQIYNRIIPLAKGDDDRQFNLHDSAQSSPYAIQSVFINAPSVVSMARLDSGAATTNTNLIGTVSVRGVNRYVVLFLHTAVAVEAFKVTCGGKEMTELYQIAYGGGATYQSIWGVANPSIGELGFEVSVDNPGCVMRAIAVALQDVDQSDPFRSVNMSNATSASMSTTITSAVNDLILAYGSWQTAVDLSARGSGQVLGLHFEFLNQELDFSYEPGVAGSTSETITLTGSGEWIMGAISLKPALTYYIEDATSVAAYRRRVKYLQLGDFKPTTGTTVTAAVDTMYFKAVNFLLTHKDPVQFYEIEVGHLAQGANAWNIGDSLHVEYSDSTAGIEIDEWRVCTRRRAHYDSDGIRHWQLTLADAFRNPVDDTSIVVGLQKSIVAIQANQV